MNPPTPLTDEQIADLFIQDRAASRLIKFVRTIEVARDAQWVEMLSKQKPLAWRPDVCPITGLPFFMWIEHHKTGQRVPTYGGPYDSYTIPVQDEDGSYCRERYDHDNGWWVTDEVDDVGVQIVSDQAYVSDTNPQPDDTALLKQALEALQYVDAQDNDRDFLRPDECYKLNKAIAALEARLK